MTALKLTRSPEPVLTHARGLHLLLDVADHEQLPMPIVIDIDAERLHLLVATHEAFIDWATWIDEPVTVSTSSAGNFHHTVAGQLLEIPVEVVWVQIAQHRPVVDLHLVSGGSVS